MDGNSTRGGHRGGIAWRAAIPYDVALRIQEALVARRRRGELPDLVWLLEHPPTITLGSAGGSENLRRAPEELAQSGLEVRRTRRGGNVTCHEPGQLVGYPIVDWGRERDLHQYLRALESALVAVLARYGLRGETVAGRTGVWLPGAPRKIAAIGVRAQGWVTSHGFALNVENSLAAFAAVVPCGIAGASVTSLARELPAGVAPGWDEVCAAVHAELERALARPLRLVAGAEARELVTDARRPRGSTSAG